MTSHEHSYEVIEVSVNVKNNGTEYTTTRDHVLVCSCGNVRPLLI